MHSKTWAICSGYDTGKPSLFIECKSYLVVRFGKVVKAGDVIQEHTKLCR